MRSRIRRTASAVALALFALAAGTQASPPQPHVLAWWNFSEGTGATLHDYSGHGKDGTLFNSPSWVAGQLYGSKPNGALQFNGGNQWIEFPRAPDLDLPGPITIQTWIKGGPSSNQQIILDKHTGSDVTGWGIEPCGLTQGADYRDGVMFVGGSGASYRILQFGHVLDNTWHNLAARYDGTSWTVFTDGNAVGSFADSAGWNYNAGNLQMGRWWGSQLYFSGAIGETAIFDAALSDAAIQGNIAHGVDLSAYLVDGAAPPVPPRPDMLAMWDFGEGSGATLHDVTGNGNTGTLRNSPSWVAGPSYGSSPTKALSLNGSNQWIDFATSSAIHAAGTMTVQTWIKGGPNSSNELIFDKSHGFTDHTGWVFQSDGSDKGAAFNDGVTFGFGAGPGFSGLEFGHVLDNTWHNLAARFDGVVWSVFTDGKKVGVIGDIRGWFTNVRALEMGRSWGGGSPVRYFAGSIGETAIFDAALSDAAILSNFRDGIDVSAYAAHPSAVYSVTDLGPGGAEAINASGQIVGSSGWFAAGPGGGPNMTHATLWDAAGRHDLGSLAPSAGSWAHDINASGQIAGLSEDQANGRHFAILWDAGGMHVLANPNGGNYEGFAVGSSGNVAGEMNVAIGNGAERATLWDATGPHDLGSLDPRPDVHNDTHAYGINGSGQIVGWSWGNPFILAENFGYQATLWDATGPHDLGSLESVGSSAGKHINDAGQVAGYSYLGNSIVYAGITYCHATRWDAVGIHDLGALGGATSVAYGINAGAQVVGYYNMSGLVDTADPTDRAALWDAGGFHDLNSLLDASGAGWILTTAFAINDSGWIVGSGTVNGQHHAFLLKPVRPVANAGPDQTVECAGASTPVTLDGNGSVSPYGPALTYLWTGDFTGGTAAAVGPTVAFTGGVGTHTVTLVVNNGQSDSPPDTMIVTIRDTTAPTLTIASPAQNAVVGSSSVVLSVQVTDATQTQVVLGSSSATVAAGGGTASLTATLVSGPNTITVTATDAGGNVSTATRMVIYDAASPIVVVDAPTSGQMFGPGESPVALMAHVNDLTATSVVSTPAGISTILAAGGGVVTGALALHEGSNLITVQATDAAGHVGSASVAVTLDTTPPVLSGVPADMTIESTSAAGAVATYTAPTAADAVDPAPVVICSPASGATFAIGTTTVTCTATDAKGNASSATFHVVVTDTTSPAVTAPADIVVEATSAAGAAASFSATATDAVDGPVAVVTSPASGSVFAIGTTSVTCSATDAHGNTGSAVFHVTVRDTTPPSLTVPADITLEAAGPTGAAATFTTSASDLVDGACAVTSTPASGATFPLGTTSVSCTSTDSRGNAAHGSFTVTVRDTTAPVLTVPADLVLEATGPDGAVATYSATAIDVVDGSFAAACTPASGGTLPLGTTTVTCSATDAAGNVAGGTFHVTVRDTTPPLLTLPANLVVEATSPDGAAAVFSATSADLVDGAVAVTCSPASASTFALGTTTVNCTATDAAGNAASGSFTVTVRDATPPALALPGDMTVEATGASGATASFTPTAADLVDGDVSVTCSPTSGGTFALGTTTVNCTATDAAGNTAGRSFTVTVRDTTPPSLTLPSGVLAEATSSQGATVNFTAGASDVVDGSVSVTCSPASGTTFAIGTTQVNCTAADAAGNAATGSFTITVGDTTAPALTLPADVTAEATGGSGAAVSFTASASDLVDGAVAVSCSASSGSMFPLGTTTVTCTATDADGNTSTGSFTVTVRDLTAPVVVVPADITAEATGSSGAAVTFAATATDVVDGTVAVTCSPASGTTFALGATTVTCTATDAAGNARTGAFRVIVRDTTAPTLSLPADVALDATSPAGVVATFTATASDVVDGSVTVVCTPASGSTFRIGTTSVTCTATDAAGNVATGTLHVTVRNVSTATITATGVAGELWPPNHKMVRFRPTLTVSGAGDAAPVVTLEIRSSEPDDGLGDGDTAGDFVIRSATDFDLRAERAAQGPGRVYTLTWTDRDAAGHVVATATAQVRVPHDQSGR